MKGAEHHSPEAKLFVGLFDAIPFGVYVADFETNDLIYVNDTFNRSMKGDKHKKCYQAIYQLSSPCAHCNMAKLQENRKKNAELTDVYQYFNEADDRWYQMQDKCITWPDGRNAKYSIAVDITDLKEVQNTLAEAHAELALNNRKLALAATTDMLTQLHNRLKTELVLEQELTRSSRYDTPLSVITIDLDHFKNVNDTYGHQVGDVVLIEAAKRFNEQVRDSDVVGRWGGEEFLVVCPETNENDGMLVAEKLRASLAETHFPIVGNVTASFGLASYQTGCTLKELIERSDKALYQAKALGRNCVKTFKK